MLIYDLFWKVFGALQVFIHGLKTQLWYDNAPEMDPLVVGMKSALDGNCIKEIEAFIAKGVDTNALLITDDSYERPLHIAVRNGAKDVLELLLKNGADINGCNKDKETPLYTAALAGNAEIVEFLIGHGARLQDKNNRGESPLHAAVASNSENTVKILVKEGADVNNVDIHNNTPVHNAVVSTLAVMNALLVEGVDLEVKNRHTGNTPLMRAVILCGKYSVTPGIVEALVEANADVNTMDKLSFTPLQWALTNNDKDTTKFLISHGARIDQKNMMGDTPANTALKYRRHLLPTLLTKSALTPSEICARDEVLNSPRRAILKEKRED